VSNYDNKKKRCYKKQKRTFVTKQLLPVQISKIHKHRNLPRKYTCKRSKIEIKGKIKSWVRFCGERFQVLVDRQ
jgi:penicillin-binding protein-related factor A (putative recombinase)